MTLNEYISLAVAVTKLVIQVEEAIPIPGAGGAKFDLVMDLVFQGLEVAKVSKDSNLVMVVAGMVEKIVRILNQTGVFKTSKPLVTGPIVMEKN